MGGWPSIGLHIAVINGYNCGMPFAEGTLAHAAAAARKVFNAAKRRVKRHQAAVYQRRLWDALKHNPRRFWTSLKAALGWRVSCMILQLLTDTGICYLAPLSRAAYLHVHPQYRNMWLASLIVVLQRQTVLRLLLCSMLT
jgi:hypothetical protein